MARGAVFLASISLGFLFSVPILKSAKSEARKMKLKITGPLFGIGIASYYLSTSLDYFVSQHYFGKILATVRIDEDIYRLI